MVASYSIIKYEFTFFLIFFSQCDKKKHDKISSSDLLVTMYLDEVSNVLQTHPCDIFFHVPKLKFLNRAYPMELEILLGAHIQKPKWVGLCKINHEIEFPIT